MFGFLPYLCWRRRCNCRKCSAWHRSSCSVGDLRSFAVSLMQAALQLRQVQRVAQHELLGLNCLVKMAVDGSSQGFNSLSIPEVYFRQNKPWNTKSYDIFSQVWLRADIWRAEQCTLDAESWLIDKLLRRCHQCPFKSRRHAPVESMRARTLFYAQEKRPERHDDVVRYSSMCILAIGAAKRAVLTLPWGERWRSGQNHRKAADGMAKRQGEMNEQRTLNWMPINWKHLRFEG